MKHMNQLAEIARDVLEPLCKETSQMLRPISLGANDFLRVRLNDDGTKFLTQAYAKLGEHEVQASWNARYKWAAYVPERKDLGDNTWELAATDITALIINAHWPRERIEFTPEAETVYTYLLFRFLKQTVASQQRAVFKLRGDSPDIKRFHPDFFDHPDRPLAPYQQLALIGSIDQEGSALFMEQGTGKTPVVIRRIMHEAHQGWKREKKMMRILVVCPKNVRVNWQREIHTFATYSGMTTVLRGGQLARMKLLVEAMTHDDSEYSVVICSYETVERSWDAIRCIPWDLCVADESHMMKWHRAKRTQRMLQLREICNARMVLTGTPIANNLFDIYTQLEFLGQGLSGFTSFNAFKTFYGQFERKRGGNEDQTTLTGYQNLPFLQERLARVAFMITKKEAMPTLPEKLYSIREVDMTPKQRELYIKLQQELALQIEDAQKSGRNKQMVVNNILTMLLRLAQITSGFVSWDPIIDAEGNMLQPRTIEHIEPNPKLEVLVEECKNLSEKSKAIVWACFVPDIKKIAERLTAEGIKCVTYYGGTKDDERTAVEDGFNQDPTVKVLIGNPGAGGTGLNLRGYNPAWEGTAQDHGCNCDHVYYYSQDWSMIKRSQSEDRAHRRGTRVPVEYIDLVVPNSIDEEIRARVMNKVVTALEIQDVRAIMQRVLDTVPDDIDE